MQTIKLNLIPGSVLPVVNVSQYDKGRQFALQVYEGATAYDLTGKGVEIRGTKPDGNGFAYDSTDGAISVSTNTVTVTTLQQMTACGGQTMAELRITSGETILGTINFILMVEPSALSDDTPISDTDIPAIERDLEAALDEAEADALIAEGYAKGTQNGTPAASGEPYYQDNAKYYNEQAAMSASNASDSATTAGNAATTATNKAGEASTSATNAGNSATSAAADALKSEGYAVGKQNGTAVTSGSPYYHDNASYWAAQAAQSAAEAEQYAQGGLIYRGSISFAQIPTSGMKAGDMYNMEDDFTTDSRFQEGAGIPVRAGTNISWNGSKWDILSVGGDISLTTTDPGAGSALPTGVLLVVYHNT